ncbi:adenylate kinase 9 [Perognathus longimembris pacificus]|uniref:adenylate kinase 9 n=1 Tax=Perognathus longimembris pacificus TaxID=214514 RepID=UPI00201868C0|nr:adenylate kinase 9 [Perognathus longimembris pacificus]
MTSQESTEEIPFADIFDEDETERNFLLSKPVCFIIFGKPGVGKTTLAHHLSQTWKCVRVEALPILEEHISRETESGIMLQSMLVSGYSIPDDIVMKLILEKLNSTEVSHFGYVITEIPSLTQDPITTLQQVELLKNLKMKPDIIINIKCPDYDICQRTSGQRQHNITGDIYSREQWDPEIIESHRKKKKEAQKEGKAEEEEEEEEQEEEEAFLAEMQMVAELLHHLVQRPEDYLENVKEVIKLYKETVLRTLEDIMAAHSPQYLIELDGNRPPEELFTVIIERLKYLNLRRAGVLTKLQSSEEEINDVMETEDLFRTLASYKLIAPRYRWYRSKWGRTCPVTLKDGNIFSGSADFAVSFLGRMYCLSSEETLKAFLLNPRPYLLPPMPMPPCKVFILGPPSSGKTTLCNLVAEHYKGKVIDYIKAVQPRFDKARETLAQRRMADTVEAAIKIVKEKILAQLHSKKQAEKTSKESEKQNGKKEAEAFHKEVDPGKEELHPVPDEDASSQEVPKDMSTEDSDETKTNTLDSQGDERETSEMSSQDLSQETKTESEEVSTEDSLPEINANHPDVVAMLADTLKYIKDINFDQPHEKRAEVLGEVLKEVIEENKDRFPGAPKYGGWVMDNCPIVRELWTVFIEKGFAPDLVICLTDTENDGKYLLNRVYLERKSEIDAKILERLSTELHKKKEEEAAVRKAKEEALRLEEEEQKILDAINKKAKEGEETPENENEEEIEGKDSEERDESEQFEISDEARGSLLPELPDRLRSVERKRQSVTEPRVGTADQTEATKASAEGMETKRASETAILPEFPEDAYPDVPEMEPFKENMTNYIAVWKSLEALLAESSIPTLNLEIANRTPKELFQKIIDTMQKPFQYSALELTMEDYDEETEDFQAEAEGEEELEEEEEEEEENEEKAKEKKRHLGDTKHFCPVALKENFILQPGSTEEAVKYREKIYYFSSSEAREKFLEHPEEYVAHGQPLKAPPVRICLLGPRGSGKTLHARYLAKKFGIFHIQFDEFLQEKMLLKTERKFGPEFEEDSEEEQVTKQELEELAIQANVKLEEETTKKQPLDVKFTEEEEAIKSSLMENEPLPPEILNVILSEWWFKEPIRSTGFVLDGFPRYLDEATYLEERGFFPDAVVFIHVEDQDICDRLLPFQIAKWKAKQKKKLSRKKLIKDMKTKIRDDTIAKRRAELISEKEKRKKLEAGLREDDDLSEEDLDDDEEDIENILEEEFPKDEEETSEEEEEQEADAIDRLKNELGEKFETEANNLQMIQDEFEKVLIPIITVNGARKIHIVQYILNMRLKSLVENRASIFEKCYPITGHLAEKMFAYTYKYISSFGYWDPVKLSEGDTIKPVGNSSNLSYPIIHRQYIYFLSSKETKEKFMKNPIKYIRQPKPKPTVPIRIMIVGPPKSGKTTVAKKLVSEYGLRRLSMGEALRGVLNNFPHTELALMLNWHLHKGMTAPDELAIEALDISMMESTCNTAGVVIDGYPVTAYQMKLLENRSIIPMIIFELNVPSKEIFKRLILDRRNEQSLPYPLHNSAQIIAVKNAMYHKNITEIRKYYQKQHQNWYVIDGFHNKWWVWNEVIKNIQMVNKHMQTYMERIKEGKAACINKLCITPQELVSRLGEFGQYCPVSLGESNELFDCSETDSLEFAAEFRGHYYKMSSKEKLNKFLENPELYVPPLAPHPLLSEDMIPKRLTVAELKSRFPKCAELQGYCPVTYKDGKQRYEALVPGTNEYAVEYQGHIYICESEEKLQKFLRSPMNYWDQKLPQKLPPLKEPISLTSLPLPGYLEQGIATSLIKAMNAVGCLKPKFPFLSIRRSALLYIAFHLKAFNPKSSEYIRKKYKKKMEQFMERCELITYLGAKMTRKYKEPQFRAIDFDHKLQTFLSLRNIDPVTG